VSPLGPYEPFEPFFTLKVGLSPFERVTVIMLVPPSLCEVVVYSIFVMPTPVAPVAPVSPLGPCEPVAPVSPLGP
jgi:hypothetical protein